MAKITINNVEEGVITKLRAHAAENGHSMEEEAQQILQNALDIEPDTDDQTDNELTPFEARINDLKKRGVIVEAKNPKKEFKPGKHVPGALERFLAER